MAVFDVTKKPFYARGDGKTDDTDNIQRALDAAVGKFKPDGTPERWYQSVSVDNGRPIWNRVYFPGDRTYRVSRPLRVWGYTEVCGDGVNSFIDGSAVPRGRGLFEFAHTNIGGWYHSNSSFHDLALFSGGHGFDSSPDTGYAGVLGVTWRNLQMVTNGWGIWLANRYSQGCRVDNVSQFNPCAGGMAVWGNLNHFHEYAIVRGYGGVDRTGGFVSPWHDRMGMIDVRGCGNTLSHCHIEFGTDKNPDQRYVPFYVGRDPWQGGASASLIGNWPEFPPGTPTVEDRGWCYWFERVDNVNWLGTPNGNQHYRDCGHVFVPSWDGWFGGRLADYVRAEGETWVKVGLARSHFDVDIPAQVSVDRAYHRTVVKGGKFFDPNPRGENLLAAPAWKLDVAPDAEATMEVGDDGLTVVVRVTKESAAAAWSATAHIRLPDGTVRRPWVLYTANHTTPRNSGWPQWWTDAPFEYAVSNTCRTFDGSRAATPLPEWKKGAGLQLCARHVGEHRFENIRVTALEG